MKDTIILFLSFDCQSLESSILCDPNAGMLSSTVDGAIVKRAREAIKYLDSIESVAK